MNALLHLGWDDRLADEFTPYADAGLVPGRVVVQHRGVSVVTTADGDLRCGTAGRLAYEAAGPGDLPAVGDWVAVAARADEGTGTIQAVLPRRTKFSRKVAWSAAEEQVVAANVDTVFLLTSLNEDLNLRRLERYLTLAWESGARPVLVLTKIDLDPERVAQAVRDIESVAFGVPVHAISTVTGEGLDALRAHILPGRTVALLGSSGVGKSTLVNTLAGREVLAVREIREDDGEGRHTTTHRQLVLLPDGGLVLDTPGMREIQLWESAEGLEEAFADVEELASQCRFGDCAHRSEPGCAVQAALEEGRLDAARWSSYKKLQRELEHLERRLDKRAQSEARKRWAQAGAEGRANMRLKGRR